MKYPKAFSITNEQPEHNETRKVLFRYNGITMILLICRQSFAESSVESVGVPVVYWNLPLHNGEIIPVAIDLFFLDEQCRIVRSGQTFHLSLRLFKKSITKAHLSNVLSVLPSLITHSDEQIINFSI